MKLKSKITAGILAVLLVALTVCCALMISVSKKNILDRMLHDTKTDVTRLENNLKVGEKNIASVKNGLTENAVLKYLLFKQTKYADADTEYVLVHGEETLYNNSGVNAVEILDIKKNDNDIKSEILHLAAGDYIVAGEDIMLLGNDCQICVVRNITSVFDQIRRLVMTCTLIGVLVLAVAGACIVIFLRTAFQPLEQLKEEADAISEGDYKQRTTVRGKDELASLSHSFNMMAASVEQHITAVEQTSEARNRLIHALSHEMRTPVTAICGYAYALRSVKMNEEQKNEALEFIDLEARRLERLSGKLTQLVGVTSKDIELVEVDLLELEQQLKKILAGKEEITVHAQAGTMQGDPDLLLMLITNLCDNARKADATHIEVTLSPEEIRVKDNGKGIEKAEQEHIFEAFYQGDSSRKQEGFGLGLALCQKIAQLHHMQLSVESQPGTGTTFYVIVHRFPANCNVRSPHAKFASQKEGCSHLNHFHTHLNSKCSDAE